MELNVMTEAQQEEALQILTSRQISQTYMLPDFESTEAAIPLFRRLCDLSREEGRFVRGIYEGDLLVGFLNDVEIAGSSIELGYVIHPEHWGKGYATAALNTAIRQLFSLGYREVIAAAFAENTASLRVMEKAGMIRMEKTEEIEYRGALHRCIYYSKRN